MVNESDLKLVIPDAMCLMDESEMLAQKETSKLWRLRPFSARKPMPMSLMLSHDRRFRSLKVPIREIDLRPVSVMLTQKLKFIFSSSGRPVEMCLKDSSVSF